LSKDSNPEIKDGGMRARSRERSRTDLKQWIDSVEKELEKFHKPYYPLILTKFEANERMSPDEAIYATAQDRFNKLPEYIGTLSGQ
jgi:hypothetical protein